MTGASQPSLKNTMVSPVIKLLLLNGMMMMILSQPQVLINVVHHPDPQFSGTFGKEA